MKTKKTAKLDQYPGEYPQTDRNCFDCLNLRIKLRVGKDREILYTGKRYAFCKEKFILRTESTSKNTGEVEVIETQYPIVPAVWGKINKGWRHHDWNVAGVSLTSTI